MAPPVIANEVKQSPRRSPRSARDDGRAPLAMTAALRSRSQPRFARDDSRAPLAMTATRHCEERSDEAISTQIATLRSR